MATFTGAVTDARGQTATASGTITTTGGTTFPDGSAGAPSGPAQFPHLLDLNSPSTQNYGLNLKARPAWNVAGVDYAVGPNAGTVFKDPGVNCATLIAQLGGCTFNTSQKELNNTATRTIDGWDFSLHGGYTIALNGPNSICSNNKFVFGSNHGSQWAMIEGAASGVKIINNYIDQVGLVPGLIPTTGVIVLDDQTNVTVMYNWIRNAYAESFVIGGVPHEPWTSTLKFNVIENAGLGFGAGAHGDFIQYQNAGGAMTSATCNYNTWIQSINMNTAPALARTQGISYAPAGPFNNHHEYRNNTMVVATTAYVSFFVGNVRTYSPQQFVTDNYVAQSKGNPFVPGEYGGGPFPNGVFTQTGNINMLTGGAA